MLVYVVWCVHSDLLEMKQRFVNQLQDQSHPNRIMAVIMALTSVTWNTHKKQSYLMLSVAAANIAVEHD